jgi:hypothetical protein
MEREYHVIFNIWQSGDDTYFRCLTVPVEDGVEQIDLKKIINVYKSITITASHQDAKEKKSKNVSNRFRPIIRVLYYTFDLPINAINHMTTYLQLIYNAVGVRVDVYGCLLKIPGMPTKNNEILETSYSVLMEELIAQVPVNADKLQSLSDLVMNSRGSPSRAAVVNEEKEDDVVTGGGDDVVVTGGGDDDVVVTGGGDDVVVTGGGGDDDDVVTGGRGGGDDDDVVTGGGGDDDDVVTGGGDDDVVTGGGGDDDVVTGGGGDDDVVSERVFDGAMPLKIKVLEFAESIRGDADDDAADAVKYIISRRTLLDISKCVFNKLSVSELKLLLLLQQRPPSSHATGSLEELLPRFLSMGQDEEGSSSSYYCVSSTELDVTPLDALRIIKCIAKQPDVANIYTYANPAMLLKLLVTDGEVVTPSSSDTKASLGYQGFCTWRRKLFVAESDDDIFYVLEEDMKNINPCYINPCYHHHHPRSVVPKKDKGTIYVAILQDRVTNERYAQTLTDVETWCLYELKILKSIKFASQEKALRTIHVFNSMRTMISAHVQKHHNDIDYDADVLCDMLTFYWRCCPGSWYYGEVQKTHVD